MTVKRIVQLSADLVPNLPAETTPTQHRHLRALVIAVRHRAVLVLSFTDNDPGCVKTSSQVCVASQFAGAIDEAIH